MPNTNDLMQPKLALEYSVTHPNEDNVGALLQRYRDELNLERWEDYVAHVASASSSTHFADDENAFWAAYTVAPPESEGLGAGPLGTMPLGGA